MKTAPTMGAVSLIGRSLSETIPESKRKRSTSDIPSDGTPAAEVAGTLLGLIDPVDMDELFMAEMRKQQAPQPMPQSVQAVQAMQQQQTSSANVTLPSQPVSNFLYLLSPLQGEQYQHQASAQAAAQQLMTQQAFLPSLISSCVSSQSNITQESQQMAQHQHQLLTQAFKKSLQLQFPQLAQKQMSQQGDERLQCRSMSIEGRNLPGAHQVTGEGPVTSSN